MGWFSPKKIISVSSSIYNLAGDKDAQADYMKSSIFYSNMENSDSLMDDLMNSYIGGPGIKQRQFFSYCKRNDYPGLPIATIVNEYEIVEDDVLPFITIPSSPSGLEVKIVSSEIVVRDPEPFIKEWILTNYPLRFSEDWLGEYNSDTSEFEIQFPNGDYFTFTNAAYNPESSYIVVQYSLILPENNEVMSNVSSTVVVYPTLDSADGWEITTDTTSSTAVSLNRTDTVTSSWADGRDDEITTNDYMVADTLNTSNTIHERTSYIGLNGEELEYFYEAYNLTGSDYVSNDYTNTVVTTEDDGGVEKTITTVTTGQQTNIQWDQIYSTQVQYEDTVYSSNLFMIYEIGSGNAALDALYDETVSGNLSEFFPFVPLRLNNVSVESEPYASNGLYSQSKKAYRKLTNGKSISSLLENIEENDSIGDIDYAYLIFGTPLNTTSQEGKQYIYSFMENLIDYQLSGQEELDALQTRIAAYEQALLDLQAWKDTYSSSSGDTDIPSAPTIPSVNSPDVTSLRLYTESDLMPSFDIRLTWVAIIKSVHTGTFTYTEEDESTRVSETDDIQMETEDNVYTWITRTVTIENEGEEYVTERTYSLDALKIYKQISDTQYEILTIYGFNHSNYIYGSNYVGISASAALADTDDSGFIIPLHYPTLIGMGIKDYTQLAVGNNHILFNSYTITKQKWYQTGIFQIIVAIVVLVATVVFAPAGAAAGTGLLGTNIAVGTALGLTGVSAIVAGVVANYLAAMMVSYVIKSVGTILFGEKLGAIFSAIASFMMALSISGTFTFSAENILQLTSTVGNAYTGWLKGELSEIASELDIAKEEYEEQMEYIDNLIAGLSNDLEFNPRNLTERATNATAYLPETADEYIYRTTLTGTDIVDITHSMVYDFVKLRQTLPRN